MSTKCGASRNATNGAPYELECFRLDGQANYIRQHPFFIQLHRLMGLSDSVHPGNELASSDGLKDSGGDESQK